MINILNIDHVVLRVVDLEKVAAFYIDMLGARWEKKQAAVGLYQLRIGTSLIDLVPVDGSSAAPAARHPARRAAMSTISASASFPGMARHCWPTCARTASRARSSRATARTARGRRSS